MVVVQIVMGITTIGMRSERLSTLDDKWQPSIIDKNVIVAHATVIMMMFKAPPWLSSGPARQADRDSKYQADPVTC